MNTSTVLTAALLCLPLLAFAQEENDAVDLTVPHPLHAAEKQSAAQLTRFAGVRLSWNDQNRVVAASLMGTDATNHNVALVSRLLGLRTLSITPLPQNHLTDRGLAPLAGHPTLQSLKLCGNRLTDRALVHIQRIPTLEILVLHGNFTNTALETISALPHLKHLDLTQSYVNEAGLVHVTELPHLETLILNQTDVGNAGLDSIAQLKELAHLYLGNTAADDGAVKHLQNLVQLETLFIERTNISEQGVAELLQALPPTCEIIHDGGRDPGQREPQTAMVHTLVTQWQASP